MKIRKDLLFVNISIQIRINFLRVLKLIMKIIKLRLIKLKKL